MAVESFKLCQICDARCPDTAILCACGFDLTFTAPTVVVAADPARLCQNGHPLAPDDRLCFECGAAEAGTEAAAPVATELVCGPYRLPLPLPESITGISEVPLRETAVMIRVYPPGLEPDSELGLRLRGIASPHLVRFLDSGRTAERTYWEAWSLTDPISLPGPSGEAELERYARHLCTALSTLHEAGILLRDLRRDSIQLRGDGSPDYVLADLSQAAIANLGLNRQPTRRTPRYLAPEAAVAAFEQASDWWSAGALLLDLLAPQDRRPDVNEQAMLLNTVTRGIPVPAHLPAMWQHLLKGLLTRDPEKRWSGAEVLRWLDGERGIPIFYENEVATSSNHPLPLGGTDCHTPEQWTLTASQARHWDEAARQLERGVLGTWLAKLDGLPEGRIDETDRLRQDGALTLDERLAAVLVLLNDRLPLNFRGELVNAAWLLTSSTEALAWLEGAFVERLSRIDRAQWFTRMRERRDRAETLAREHGIPVDRHALRAASLVTEDAQLMRRWVQRRQDLPVARRRAVAVMAEKAEPLPEELVVLLAASPGEFLPAPELIDEATQLARSIGAEFFDPEQARAAFRESQREIHRQLNQQLSGFVRCGRERLDEWADEFRHERRLPMPRILILRQVPAPWWQVSENPARDLIDYFQKRIVSGIQQGPLLRLRTTKTSRNIDWSELGGTQLSAGALLQRLLSREERTTTLDPSVFQAEPNLERRIRRLSSVASDYLRDTGIDSLYLGFPLLVFRPKSGSESAQPKRAPLFLWPIKLQAAAGQRGHVRIGYDRQRAGGGELDREGVELNPALSSLLGTTEVDGLRGVIDEALARTQLTPDGLFQLCQAALPRMKAGPPEVQAMPGEAPRMAWGDGWLLSGGALFLCDFSQQTIAQDLRMLRNRPLDGTALAHALRLEEAPEPAPQPVPEKEKFFVLAADPSQERAVLRARQHRGLVIQGPPGTGKSQTIVNIVADCMGRGERVLVVCQKHAALEVVGRRLSEQGLGDRFFFVEDVRKNRRIILGALREQTAAQAPWRHRIPDAQREEFATRIERLEAELGACAQALHEPVGASGVTYTQIVDELIELRDLPKIAAFKLRQALAPQNLQAVRSQARQIQGLAALWFRSDFFASPWQALGEFSPDPGSIGEFRASFQALLRTEAERHTLLVSGEVILPLTDPDAARRWLEEHRSSLTQANAATLQDAWHWREWFDAVGTAEVDQMRETLTEVARAARILRPLPRQHDFGAGLAQLLPRQFRSLRQAAQQVVASQTAPAWTRLLPQFWWAHWQLSSFRNSHSEGTSDSADFDHLIAQVDWEHHRRLLADQLRQTESRLGIEPAEGSRPEPGGIASRATDLEARLAQVAVLAKSWRACPAAEACGAAVSEQKPAALARFLETMERGIRYAEASQRSIAALHDGRRWFLHSWCDAKEAQFRNQESIQTELDRMTHSLDSAADFLTFRTRFQALPKAEQTLLQLLDAYRAEFASVPIADLAAIAKHTVVNEALLAWKTEAEQRHPTLLLRPEEFADRVTELREVSASFREANRAELQTPWLASTIGLATHWTDVLLIRGARSLSLRGIVEAGIDLGLFNLRPVWLANPETVSRLFPLREDLFDVVIFDEASQMPLEMAVPALFRARRAVVSGDRKQLPPTNFFRSESGDDESGEEDLEDASRDGSFLDDESRARLQARINRREIKDCEDLLQLAESGMPEVLLTIHYRSSWRHLIQFSNHAFYQGRLSVPVHHPEAVIRAHQPLEVRHVRTPYSNQINEGEAEAIVDFLRDHWSQPTPPSIGIVTFNAKQAERIEQGIETRMEECAEFRRTYERELQRSDLDRFFIRNLENVQGDERDWIVFSTTFGPDASGRFIRNFGPLIQRGGERRLNVAVTRSREKMVIFTSLPIPEIASSPAGSGGNPREILKSYLSYAEAVSAGDFGTAEAIQQRILAAEGISQVRSRARFAAQPRERALVRSVREFLQSRGLSPESGTSRDAFGFDLALVDPTSGQYALAIECDPPLHDDLDSARSREIWRPEMMRGTIPGVVRVWSRAWWEDPEHEQARLLNAIAQHLPS